MTLTPQRLIFPDEADAIAYWRGREIKTWAVDVQAGPPRRPSYYQTVYVDVVLDCDHPNGEGDMRCIERAAVF